MYRFEVSDAREIGRTARGVTGIRFKEENDRVVGAAVIYNDQEELLTVTTLTCFKAYDIRGQLGAELNENIAYRIGRAYAQFLDAKRIVIGGDMRLKFSRRRFEFDQLAERDRLIGKAQALNDSADFVHAAL